MIPEKRKYFVYIVQCKDETLYTGYTVDLSRRIDAHNSSRGAKYTRGRTPVKLVYSEEFRSINEALKRERNIKSMTRKQKIDIINSNKFEWGIYR